MFGDKSDGISQGLGQVGGMLLTGGLGNAAGLGMAGTSALTTGTTFLSGTGRGMSQAYEEGASDKKAFKYGLIAGAVTSGIAQSGYVPGMKQGSFREATSQGRDLITGLSSNEQKVLDAEIQNRISDEEKNGKKLTNKEKSAIAKQAEKDLKRGYVSIDTIESTLGGDSYSTYKGRIDSEEKLQKEIKQLENIPESQFTVGQRERLNKAREELAKLQETDSSELKSKLSSEVDKITADDIYLRESYNEKGRRSTAYEADISKYNEKQQGTIQKAIDSGILNNTNRTHEFVDMIAKISADKGVSFDFADSKKLKESGFGIEGKTINGVVKGKDVTLNVNSSKALNRVVGHEITHVLEGTDMYSELQAAVKEYAESKGEYQHRRDALASLYKDVEGAVIENELTADMVGDYLFTDEDFINNLSTEKPGIFKKIYEEIKYLVKVATAGSKEAKQLEKVKRAFEKAYKQNMNNDHKIKYALTEYTDDQIESILKGSDREILKTDEEIKEFASRALVNDERETFGYLGIVSSDIIERIKSEVSEISAENRENLFGKEAYSLRIRQSEIAHLKKEGMTVEEAIDYVSKIPQIVTEFDEVRYSVNYRAGKRIEGLTFTKVFPNGKMYSYLMVSNKKGTMTVKTTYMDKHDYMKKGKKNKPSLVANTDVLANTSETRSASASNINVSQNSEKSSESIKYSLSEDNENIAPVGNYNVHGKELLLESIDDIRNRATSHETTDTKPSQPVKVQNDYTPNPEVYETEVTDTEKLIDAKIENYKVELESKLERKEETHNYYNQEIARKQSILDKKKNKATKVARDLADQIERLKRNRDNADVEADK